MYTPESTQAAAYQLVNSVTSPMDQFKCSVCSSVFANYDSLRRHYDTEHPHDVAPVVVALHLNGKHCEIVVNPHWTFQRALQYKFGLTGAKHMCDKGVCGSCTVIIDGRSVLSCTTLAVEVAGKTVQTVEGIAADPKWKPLIDAYCKWDAMQCGYCTPGFMVAAKNLLDKNPDPTEQECREALAGNICICGTYPRHAQAILEAAKEIYKGGNA
ncbi:MAG: (2Fe-2S)-binding protein [Oscillospiraceae bacterium]|nr:(2Fe-2S)-binding protein [Oscillospiraceae bacterium]